MTTATTVKLGQAVEYVSTRGLIKLAFVIGTPETAKEGTSVPELTEGQLHLMVFSLRGTITPRYNVPSAESVQDNDGFKDDNGDAAGVYRTIA